ncbi:Ig-like domain-containing protein [Echinicola sp. 20G]|uniref:Ig-like domain-containing protein n=1 Tax=Echinicola sp. 20G TaxID=2781961 RepID=UPI00191008DC|nr:Ig-like domain-containing protein [Echinicola sp. 20G]
MKPILINKSLNKIQLILLCTILFVFQASCTEEELVDNIPPSVTILEPVKYDEIDESFEIIYDVEEDNIDSISIYLGDDLLESTSELTQRKTLNAEKTPDGVYYLKVYASDLSGNTGGDSTLVTLDRPDTEAPVINKMIPEEGTFTQTFMVEIEAVDNEGIKSVQVYLNNGLVSESNKTPYIYQIDISSFRNGVYPLRAVVTDYEGNQTSIVHEISIVNEPNMDKPLNLEASKGESWNTISLSWQAVPKANNYQIFRLNTEINEYELVGVSKKNEFKDIFEAYNDPLTEIYYKVRAYNSEVEFSPFSEIEYGYYTRSYEEVLSFGKEGSNPGEFKFSEHVTLDDSGNFFISETNKGFIQKFSPEGIFLEKFYSCGSPRGMVIIDPNKILVTCSSDYKVKIMDWDKNVINQWGSNGIGNGQFKYFRQVAIEDDLVYIVDHSNHRVQKMDLKGDFIEKWGSEGMGDGQFTYPWGITIHKDAVVVSSDNRLQFFDKNGQFIKSWEFENALYDLASDGEFLYAAAGDAILKIGDDRHFVDKIGDFTVVIGVALKENGDVVAMDTYGRKLKVYRPRN